MEDSGGNFTGTDVEAVLAELAANGSGGGSDWLFVAKLAMKVAQLEGSPVDFIGEVADSFEDASGFDSGSSTNAQVTGGVLKPTGGSSSTLGTLGQTQSEQRTVSGGSKAGFQFTAPADGSIDHIKFDVATNLTSGDWEGVIYSDSSDSPDTQVGSASGTITVISSGEITFTFSTKPSIINGNKYWAIMQPASGSPGVTLAVCANQASYGSDIDATITAMTPTGLPNTEDFRAEIGYSMPINDMEAWLEAVTLPAEPDTVDVYGIRTDNQSITVNTDLIVKVSIDGGATFTIGTIVDVGTAGNLTVFKATGIDVSGQTGTSLVGRIETANNVDVEINDIFQRAY